jgi:hypothetical protein
MDTRPTLYSEYVADGALMLYLMRRNTVGGYNQDHVATLFHPDFIAETLRDGYLYSDGWRAQNYRVVLVSDIHEATRMMFAAAVEAGR